MCTRVSDRPAHASSILVHIHERDREGGRKREREREREAEWSRRREKTRDRRVAEKTERPTDEKEPIAGERDGKIGDKIRNCESSRTPTGTGYAREEAREKDTDRNLISSSN